MDAVSIRCLSVGGGDLFLRTDVGKWIFLHRLFHITVADVRIDLRGVELFVTENVLQNADINVARLIHQGGGGMTKLMHRVVL